MRAGLDRLAAAIPDPELPSSTRCHETEPALSDWDSTNSSAAPSGAVRGGAAVTISMVGQQLLSLCVIIILARQLTPEDFGVVAVAVGVLALLLPFHDAGLAVATVQRERLSLQAVSTMFWINAGLGLLLTLVLAASAGPLADLLRRPDLVALFRVLSIDFVLVGLAAQHRALLQRSMRFGTRSRIELGSALVGGLSAIVMALLGFGIWALAAQLLIRDGLALLLMAMVVRWKLTRPSFTTEIREMVTFGTSFLGFNVVFAIASNLYVVLLGGRAGAAAAGLYTRAYALASIPQTLLQAAAAMVATAKLSRTHGDRAAFAAFYCRGVQLLTLMALPAVIALAGFGDQIVFAVYGQQWGSITPLMPIFAAGLAVVPLLNSTGPVFIARGHPRRMLRWGVFGSTVIVAGTVIGLRWGITGVAVGWSTAMIVLAVPGLLYAFRGTDITLRGVAHAVWGIYAAGACALGLARLIRPLIGGLPVLAELLAGLGACLLVYVALCYFAFGQRVLIEDVFRRLRPRTSDLPRHARPRRFGARP